MTETVSKISSKSSSQPNEARVKNIAVIASSGGGAATLGHTEPVVLLRTIHHQLCLINSQVSNACFIALDLGKGMDMANQDVDTATLYCNVVDESTQNNDVTINELNIKVKKQGLLSEVNKYCQDEEDVRLAELIKAKKIHGLICISCNVFLFQHTFKTAAACNIPVTGSGGTSLAQASSIFNIKFCGNTGGSVATTSYTRAVSYAHAFAVYWQLPYKPWQVQISKEAIFAKPSVRSILNSTLPAFWGAMILKRILILTIETEYGMLQFANKHLIHVIIQLLENTFLPTACAVVAATSSKGSQNAQEHHTSISSLVMTAGLASITSQGSIMSGLLTGLMASYCLERMLYFCICQNIPATMTNMLTIGGIGTVIALIFIPISVLLTKLSEVIIYCILWPISVSDRCYRCMAGALYGLLSCYGSKVGWYHAYHLPLILLEMEHGDVSFLGAIDVLTLVLVCAGICTANTIIAKIRPTTHMLSDADVVLSKRGLLVNLLCGDFIEVCYPFMESSLLVNIGGYVGSALSCAWLASSVTSIENITKSSAYVPLPISIALAGSEYKKMLLASIIAFTIPFVFTLVSHVRSVTSNIKKEKIK